MSNEEYEEHKQKLLEGIYPVVYVLFLRKVTTITAITEYNIFFCLEIPLGQYYEQVAFIVQSACDLR